MFFAYAIFNDLINNSADLEPKSIEQFTIEVTDKIKRRYLFKLTRKVQSFLFYSQNPFKSKPYKHIRMNRDEKKEITKYKT